MSAGLFWFIMWLIAMLGCGAIYDIGRRSQKYLERVIQEHQSHEALMNGLMLKRDCEVRVLSSKLESCHERFSRIMNIATDTENESAHDYEGA